MIPVLGVDLQVREIEAEPPVLLEGRFGFDLEENGTGELDRIAVHIAKLDSQGKKLNTVSIDEAGEPVKLDLGGNPGPDSLDRALRTETPRLEGEHQEAEECDEEA